MATKKIEYEDKVDLQIWGSVPDKNKVKAEDMNEIKDVVNNNEKELVETQTKLEKVEKEFDDYAIHGQASGEFIHLTDSAKSSCKIDVKGNVKQTVTEQSANLLDSYFENKTINGITASYNSEAQEVTLNGTCTKNNTVIEFLKFKAIEMNANENIYLITKYISGSCTAGANCAWGVYNSTFTKNLTAKLNGINSDKEGSLLFTDTTVLSLARIRIDEGDVLNSLKIKVMVSKEDTEYVPFVPDSPSLDYPAPIQTVKDSVKVTSCNENLLDNILNNHEINGVKVVVNSDKSLTLNGTSTANIILNVGVVKLKPNTYCMSGSPEGSSYTTYFLDVGSDGKDYGNGFSFIVDEETVVTARLAVRAGVTLNNLKFCPKIEIGSVETPYKTHEQNSVTVSIQQEMLTNDYLDKTNKKEVHFWDKLKVKDKISRIIKRQAENRTSFNYTVENVKPNTWTVIKNNAICNRFVQVSPYVVEKSNCFSVWNGDNVITITIDNSYLKDVSSDEKILESWNELLNKWESEGEPLELFYERQDSKEIDLTQEQIEALEKLDEMQTYKNITNITTDSIAILDVDYKKDLETWQKQQDDRITALEELLSTTQTSAMLVENLENDLLKEVE